MKKYDVIVIGAGNGGLAAATKVLNAGKTCLVCEKHNIPGGFATSFVRGRFEFEASLHEFNGIGTVENPGSSRKLFEELGVADKIDWIQIKDAYRLISIREGYDFVMPFGLENFIEACGKLCPDGDKYARRFLELCEQVKSAMGYLSESKGRPDPKVLMEKYPDYLRCGSYTVGEVYEALNFPQIIIDNFNAYWSYLGADVNNLTFLHYANMLYSYVTMGACVPKLRSHELSLAFETRIHELGGDIFYNSEVTKILTDDKGHVSGVELADGTRYETRHVIANCSPHLVYGKLLEPSAVPERALKLTNSRKLAGRGFTAFYAFNKSPEELGITNHNYFIYDSSDSVEEYKKMENLYGNYSQATVCLNHVDPDCSPKGTTILYITTLFTTDAWAKVEEKDYFKVKNEIARNLLAQFEKATNTHLAEHLEELAIATPVTYARYCGHPQGVIYGYESAPRDGLLNRIMAVEEDRFVDGLRICGGYGERLDGFPSSYKSGANEAGRTLKDMQKEGD